VVPSRRILAARCFDLAASGHHPAVGPTEGAEDEAGMPLSLDLPAVPESVRSAREFVVATLGRAGWLDRERLEQLALVTSELATNAVIHAGTELQVRVSFDEHEARIEVVDGVHARPQQVCPRPLDTGGRGLMLVNALVDEWGVEDLDGQHGGPMAKKVWVRLTVD
jgi:anti-sigma regulatory factor (Ser/Thr protein kinase)